MHKIINTFYQHPPKRPFSGCCSAINASVIETLKELGHEVQGVHGDGRWNPRPVHDAIPMEAPQMVMQIKALPKADIAIHCDSGLRLGGLRRTSARKHVVFFHGFGGFNTWARNTMVTRFWGYSRYVHDVVRSLLGMPDMQRRQLLDPRGFGSVSFIRMALPCIEYPAGAYAEGAAELPAPIKEAIVQGDILGHCVMASKVDTRAAYTIILMLNRLAQENRLGRKLRLVVGEGMFDIAQSLMQRPSDQLPAEYSLLRDTLKSLNLNVADILIPVPLLAQGALFELMRACRFGLFYNVYQEPFGFYPLESVFHDCPVYTNGIGNLRSLLPDDHGISVCESEDMVTGNLHAYLPVAQTIYEDIVRHPEATRERCRRGTRYIRENYNRDTMRDDIRIELERLDEKPERIAFDSLITRLGPLVRHWNPASGIAVTDSSWRRLHEREVELLQAVLDQPIAGTKRWAKTEQTTLEQLFREGILSLRPPGEAPSTSKRSPMS